MTRDKIDRDLEAIDDCRRSLDQLQYRLIQERDRLPKLRLVDNEVQVTGIGGTGVIDPYNRTTYI